MSGDPIDLDAIEARAKAASEGPWQADAHSHIQSGCRCLSCYDDPTVYQLSTFLDCEDVPRWDDDATRCQQSGFQTWADADFAAHARTDVPALVAEVRRLREIVNALREEWAVRYEHDTDPTMDNASGVRTQSSVVASRATAEQAVKNRAPLGSANRNRRVSHRLVTEWVDVP